MSAFMVSTETMQRVVAACAQQEQGLFGGMAIRTSGDLDKLGQALFAMNADAVADRYRKETVHQPVFRYRPMGKLRDLIIYRALSCYLYQCAEGDIPERQLFRDLKALENRLAHNIASRMADEAKLPWDWPETSRSAA